MKMRLPRSKPYRLLQAIRFASFTLAAVASGVLGLPESSDPDATRFLASLNEWGWWVVFGSMIVGGGATVWMRSTDRHGLEGVLGDVLEDFRAELFGKRHRGDHRVTLFAYRRFWWGAMLRIKWPRTGWLIPVARSGHTKQRSGTYFRVPDDDSRAEGVAGRAWAAPGRMVAVDGLPDMQKLPEDPLERVEAIERYAEATYVTEEWVERKRPRSRSIAGFAIERTNTDVWGVLVLDSRNPHMDLEKARLGYRSRIRILESIARAL